jgi:hypothetical protein
MSHKNTHRERSSKPSMIESLEDRALMSATPGATAPALSQPVSESTAVVLPAVQKTGGFTAPQSSGIIAILIGL